MTLMGTETKSAGMAKATATVLGAGTATTTTGPPHPELILANAGSAATIRAMAIANLFISFISYCGLCPVQWRKPARHVHRLQTYGDHLAEEAEDGFGVVGAVRVVGDAAAFVDVHDLGDEGFSRPP